MVVIGAFCFMVFGNVLVNLLVAIVRICGHHPTKHMMPDADSDFENSRCPSDVSDTKLTNTDDS